MGRKLLKQLSFVLILSIFILFTIIIKVSCTGAQATYYIDPTQGNDSNTGKSASKAWKTIAKAQSFIRTNKGLMKGNIIVYLRGGTYPLESTLIFTEKDSGNNGFNVIYQAYKDEKPVISGGKKITGFTLHDISKNIYKASVGSSVFRQIYVEDKRAVRARTPNVDDETTLGPYHQNAKWIGTAPYKLIVDSSEIQDWSNLNQVEVVMIDHWKHKRARINDITTTDNRSTISFTSPESRLYPMYHFIQEGTPHFYENAYEFLDSNNEWYLDTNKKVLFYKPQGNQDMKKTELIVPVVETLITFKGSSQNNLVKNIRFEGITFKHTNYTTPSSSGYIIGQAGVHNMSDNRMVPGAVSLENAKNITIDSCEFTNLGAHAILGSKVVQYCQFTYNSISCTSSGGIILNSNSTLSKGNVIKNNTISNGGMEYTDAVGIFISMVPDISVSHNEIYNYRYTGISVGFQWDDLKTAARNNDISYNNVHHVLQLHDDGAGIYTLGKIEGMGIKNNYIHDISGSQFSGNFPIAGIYLDNGSSSKLIKNNVITNCNEAFHAENKPNYGNYFDTNYYDGNIGKITNTNMLVNSLFIDKESIPQAAIDIIKDSGIEDSNKQGN